MTSQATATPLGPITRSMVWAGLLAAHPSISRIVFSTGKESAALFLKHHKPWLRGEGVPRVRFTVATPLTWPALATPLLY